MPTSFSSSWEFNNSFWVIHLDNSSRTQNTKLYIWLLEKNLQTANCNVSTHHLHNHGNNNSIWLFSPGCWEDWSSHERERNCKWFELHTGSKSTCQSTLKRLSIHTETRITKALCVNTAREWHLKTKWPSKGKQRLASNVKVRVRACVYIDWLVKILKGKAIIELCCQVKVTAGSRWRSLDTCGHLLLFYCLFGDL